jgi:hypothetical protein
MASTLSAAVLAFSATSNSSVFSAIARSSEPSIVIGRPSIRKTVLYRQDQNFGSLGTQCPAGSAWKPRSLM